MFSRLVSTRRATADNPSRKIAGSTVATNGASSSRDVDRKPIATSELDSAITYSVLRGAASEIVELTAFCSTKCSVVSAESSSERDVVSSIGGRARHANYL